jgi:ABC-type branched-subunit amino acid transport system substrate-binding protein
MKKNMGICVVILICIGFAVLAKNNADTASHARVPVGVFMPFSTDWAWWGDTIRNTIKLAQSDGYARDFEFIYEDTKCDTKNAVSAVQSSKALYPTMHMFIVGCDNDLKAMTPLLDANKDLGFMAGLSAADLYETHFPIVNLAYRLENEGAATARFISEQLGVKTTGIIIDNGAFGKALGDSFSNYIESIGGETITEQLKWNQPNIETSVLKIIKDNPDAVYIQNDIPTLVAILKRLDQLNYRGKRILYYGGHDQGVIDGAGKSAEGTYVSSVVADMGPMGTAFKERYKGTYGKEPFVTAYFVYDGLVVLDKAYKACAGDVRCIETYFYNKVGFSGMLGDVIYKQNGEVGRTFYFERVRGGKFVGGALE